MDKWKIFSIILALNPAKKIGGKLDRCLGTKSPLAWGALGLFCLLLGISFGWIVFPMVLNKLLQKNINLAYGEDTKRNWINTPVLEFNIYLFNVTNQEAVRRGAKPVLQEIGPYCYRELKEKVELSEDPGSDTISYRYRSSWFADQGRAGCAGAHLTGEETLIVPNVPLLSILLVAEKDFPAPFLAAVNVALPGIFGDNSDLFLTATARTLLFDGILLDCRRRGLLASPVCRALRERSEGLKSLGEDRYSFSYLGKKNGSVESARYTVLRGASEAADVGRLVAVDGRPQLGYWRGDCNTLHGTDGSIFPPFRRPDNLSLVAYSGEVCRVVQGVYEGERVANGVPGYAYTVTLGDTDDDPRDRCYCAAADRCYKRGTLDAFRCQGAPLVASLPHFYASSDIYARGVEGLRPDKDKHGILLILEPTSGTPLIAKKRIQMNIDLKPVRFTPSTQSLRRALVPLFWAEELFELNGELLDLLEVSLLRPIKLVHVGRWMLIVLGIAFLLFSILIKVKRIRSGNLLDPGRNFDYGPDLKEKLKYLQSEETVVRGPFFIDTRQSLPQPRWGRSRGDVGVKQPPGLVRTTETTLAGTTRTVKYKRISGLKEIMVKEQMSDS